MRGSDRTSGTLFSYVEAPWAMEIAIGAVVVRVRGDADAGLLAAALKALRVRP